MTDAFTRPYGGKLWRRFWHLKVRECGRLVIFGRDDGIANFCDRNLCELVFLSRELEG